MMKLSVRDQVARHFNYVTGSRHTGGDFADELKAKGLLAEDKLIRVRANWRNYGNTYSTVKAANAAGVYSGTLKNGDTFGDEDDPSYHTWARHQEKSNGSALDTGRAPEDKGRNGSPAGAGAEGASLPGEAEEVANPSGAPSPRSN